MRRSISVFTVVALIALAGATAADATPLGVREIGRWPYGQATTVTRDGDLVFFGTGSTLQILRVTAPDSLELISEVVLEEAARDIVVHDNHLLIASGWTGLQIVDIADPTEPLFVTTKHIGGSARSIAIADDVAWVSTVLSGIQALDISDPTNPVRIGAVVPALESLGLDIADGLLWATSEEGFHAIDITDPSHPRVLSSTDSSRWIYDIRVVDHLAYVTGDDTELEIFDVEDPEQPVLLGRFDHGDEWSSDVEVAGSTAFIASFDNLWLVDVSDPHFPHEVARSENVGYSPGRCMALDGDWLAVADGGANLRVLDVSDRADPSIVLTRGAVGTVGAIEVADDVILHASRRSGEGGLRLIDISDPTAPTQIGDPVGPADLFANDMVMIDNHLYVASYENGIHIYDFQDPAHPVFARTCDIPAPHGRADGVAEWNGHLVVAGDLDGLVVYHLDDPTNPWEIGRYGPPHGVSAEDVFVDGDIAYIVGPTIGLTLVDLSDPSNPMAIHEHPGFSADRVTVSNDIAYVTAGPSGLIIIDVSNPFSTVELARVEGRWIRDVAVKEGRALVRASEYSAPRINIPSIRFLDVSDPANPMERGFRVQDSSGLAISGSLGVLAESATGLNLIDLDAVFEPRAEHELPRSAAID